MGRIVTALAMVAALAATATARADERLGIGFLTAQVGGGANVGQDAFDGFQLGIKHSGGRLGNVPVTLVPAADGGTPQSARDAAEKLVNVDQVPVLISASASRLLPAYFRSVVGARVFLIGLTPTPAPFDGKQCSPFYFSMAGTAAAPHEVMAQYLSAAGTKRVALVGVDLEDTHTAFATFKKAYKGEVVAEVTSPTGRMRFASEIDAIRQAKPDAVYAVYTGGMGANFFRQFAAAGLKADIPVFGPEVSFDQTLLPAIGDDAIEMRSAAFWSEDVDVPTNKRLVADFEAEYGRPASIYAASGYDAALLLDAALRITGGKYADRDMLREAMRKAEFAAVRGTFRFNTNHQPIQTYYLRQVVKDAKGRLTNETRAVIAKDYRDPHVAECDMRWNLEQVVAPQLPGRQPAASMEASKPKEKKPPEKKPAAGH